MEHIKNELQIISNSAIKRRLQREFEKLVLNELLSPESVSVKLEETKRSFTTNYIVTFYSSVHNKYFEFIISSDYPFKPPKLNLNFKPYSYLYYLNSKSPEFKDKLMKYKNIRCFCCISKLCNDNWSPGYTIQHVMDEVDAFKNICLDIVKVVIVNVIKRKYLIEDIDIIKWLF